MGLRPERHAISAFFCSRLRVVLSSSDGARERMFCVLAAAQMTRKPVLTCSFTWRQSRIRTGGGWSRRLTRAGRRSPTLPGQRAAEDLSQVHLDEVTQVRVAPHRGEVV